MKLAFAVLGVCLYATSLSSGRAQIVWLGEDRPHDSRFEVWSRATTGQIPQESINASIACRKGSCPVWGGIYNPDFEVVLDPAGFDRKSLAIDEVVVPERGTFRTTTEAWQQTRLGPREMESTGRIELVFVPGLGQARARGIASSTANVHFQVIGRKHRFRATGFFRNENPGKSSAHGFIGLLPERMASADHVNVYWWTYNAVDKAETPIDQSGILPPGIYRLSWGFSNDHYRDATNLYHVRIEFQECDDGASAITHCNSYRTMDEAAQAALEQAWRLATRFAQWGNDVEWGGFIYKVADEDFRYVEPMPGRPSAPGELAILNGNEMNEQYDQVFKQTLPGFPSAERRVGQYHTHPVANTIPYLSFNDINAAISDHYTVYMRGINGPTCGIHKYDPDPLHVAVDQYLLPQINPFAYKQEVEDPRRQKTQWIELAPGPPAKLPCTSLGVVP